MPIDATDITFDTGSGGLGLGAPSFTGAPAAGTDIAGTGIGTHAPAFNPGSNLGSGPIGTNFAGAQSAAPSNNVATDPSLSQGGSTNPGVSDVATAGIPGTVQNYFMRALVIITGMIFLAVGLKMLGMGSIRRPSFGQVSTE